MDLETENRLATMLLKEAAELRRQAEREGALAYLRRPNVRCRPNSRFLSSTVMGVEQANRALEVGEMWRARQKEIELDRKSKCKYSSGHSSTHMSDRGSCIDDTNKQHRDVSCSSTNGAISDGSSVDGKGLRDEEVEEFLRSRVKRGRGSIGSRIDETGPYLPRQPDLQDDCFLTSDHYREEQQSRIVLGPGKPTLWRYNESSVKDDLEDDVKRRKKSKSKEKKRHSKKRKSMEKSKEGKKKSSHRKRHKH